MIQEGHYAGTRNRQDLGGQSTGQWADLSARSQDKGNKLRQAVDQKRTHPGARGRRGETQPDGEDGGLAGYRQRPQERQETPQGPPGKCCPLVSNCGIIQQDIGSNLRSIKKLLKDHQVSAVPLWAIVVLSNRISAANSGASRNSSRTIR